MRKLSRQIGMLLSSILLVLGFMVPRVVAQPASVVVPNTLAAAEGNLNNQWPFNSKCCSQSQRYQQVYAASQFAAFAGPQRITKLAFRPDAELGAAFSATLPNVEIRLSTTQKQPDGLSVVFADNVGADDTVVYAGALTLSSAFVGPAAGPKAFDIVIPFQTPFVYDPAAGSLLLDVRIFANAPTTPFDAYDGVDSVSRSFTINSDGVNDLAGLVDTIGLVTQFTMATAANTPGARSDCTNNGWQTRTRADGSPFKNQGDCVQYVQTGK